MSLVELSETELLGLATVLRMSSREMMEDPIANDVGLNLCRSLAMKLIRIGAEFGEEIHGDMYADMLHEVMCTDPNFAVISKKHEWGR